MLTATNHPMFAPESVYTAYRECRRRKRGTVNAMRFEANLEENVLSLSRDLRNGVYRPGRSVVFLLDKPKRREIFAADFRDRVVHHLLVREVEPLWERRFIHDSYACRKGKGTHAGVKRVRQFTRKATANGTRQAFYLQLDIRGYFINIDRPILFDRLIQPVRDPSVMDLAAAIVYHEPTLDCVFRDCRREDCLALPAHKTLFRARPLCGLPIGNLTSQFFANVYLDALDQFVKHELRCRFYTRYCDDFVLLHERIDQLREWERLIERFLQEALHLELNPRRRLQRISNGIDFLGYIIRPHYLLVRRRTVNALKRRLEGCRSRAVGTPNATASVCPGHSAAPSAVLCTDRRPEDRPWYNAGRPEPHAAPSISAEPWDSPHPRRRRVRFDPQVVATVGAWLQSYFGHFKLANTHRLKDSVFRQHPFLNDWFELEHGVLRERFPAPRGCTRYLAQVAWYRRLMPRAVLAVQRGDGFEVFPADRSQFQVLDFLGISRTVPPSAIPTVSRHLSYARLPVAWIKRTNEHNGFVYTRHLVEIWL